MVSIAIKQLARRTLADRSWMWGMLRQYVRHAAPPLVPRALSEQLDRYLAGHPRRFVTRTRFGAVIAGDTADIVERHIFLYGVWAPHLTAWLARRLRRGDVFVDVGASIGYFSLLASQLVGAKGTVVAVEASPGVCAQLRANIDLNRLLNVRVLHTAVGDARDQRRSFRAYGFHVGASAADSTPRGAIETKPLARLLTTAEVMQARVIRVNAEGAEIDIVKGLLPLLSMARCDLEIVVGIGGGPRGPSSAQAVAAAIVPVLTAKGFNVYRIVRDYRSDACAQSRVPARPERVADPANTTAPCELIFSRRNAALL